MEKMIKIIYHPSTFQDKPNGEKKDVFGKFFTLPAISNLQRIVVHLDFPLIAETDIDDFVSKSTQSTKPTISCRRVRTHPYRAMVIGEDGYDNFLAEIPQSIRGNRHLYPEVFELVPALMAIPPGFDMNLLPLSDEIGMYEMDERKLLDKTKQIDRLLLKCL